MSDKTLFQRIMDKEIPANIVHEDDHCIAFHDIQPQAPTHLLVVPRKPIPSLDHLQAGDAAVIGHIYLVIQRLAADRNLNQGYRVVVNCGAEAGQTVDHVHFHLLGGRPMEWPPG